MTKELEIRATGNNLLFLSLLVDKQFITNTLCSQDNLITIYESVMINHTVTIGVKNHCVNLNYEDFITIEYMETKIRFNVELLVELIDENEIDIKIEDLFNVMECKLHG